MAIPVRAQHGVTKYDRRWAVVDSLLQEAGQPKSAMAEVSRISALARQEHNRPQEIKALIYKVTIGAETRDNDSSAIREMERLVSESMQPSRSILQCELARQYWDYLRQNRGRLYNRTATSDRSNSDFSTWTADDFHLHIRELFLASLKDEELLKRSDVKDWTPVLIKGNTPGLRPTLFDVLAHEALDYFQSSETGVNQPEQVFEIDDPAVFADAPVFAAHDFAKYDFATVDGLSAGDSSSTQFQALLLYQRLLRFHLADKQPDALIDADIDRLQFARANSVAEDKDDRYLTALTRLIDQWGDKPAVAQAEYLEAKYYYDEGSKTGEAPDSAGSDRFVQAKARCEQVLKEPDSSEGKANCRVLLQDILRPSLELSVEEFDVPYRPFRCLVKWSNVDRAYFRVVKIDSLNKSLVGIQSAGIWKEWLRAPAYRSFTQDLSNSTDYRVHSTEIAVGSLPPGTYALIASINEDWGRQKNILAGQKFYVTSMAYIREGRDYFLVNRETGQPVTDARVQAWRRIWKNGTAEMLQRETYHPDQQGHFQEQELKSYEERCFELRRPGEDIFLSGQPQYYSYGSTGENVAADKTQYESTHSTVYFFLDRSIYRPGQTVYFKGISITRDYDNRQLKPMAGRHAKVDLYDANHEKIDSLDLVTDEFGAYHGAFHLPDHGLNGQFRINDHIREDYGQSFSVEEYKRPRFYVGFDPVKGSYRVGDSIRVHGNAKAYAGNNLDGVTVKYRITRLARYPEYSFYEWRRVIPQNDAEIAHGVLKTDADGGFRIAFTAKPDRSIPIGSDPRFDYRVTADVTDINGETRSGSTAIVAGYTVLDLAIGLEQDAAMPADSLRSIRVAVSNLSGEPVATAVHVAAYRLQAPDRLIRERLWETIPDRWVMTERAFLDSFPHDPYRDDLNKSSWARGAMAWEGVDSTGGRTLALELKPGWWVIEATATDSFGKPVKDRRYVELDDNQTGCPVNPEYMWGGSTPASLMSGPGEVARVQTGSSARDVQVIRQVVKAGQAAWLWHRSDEEPENMSFQHFMVSGDRNITDWKVTEADRGGFAVADAFVKENRLYVHRTLVKVPWDNKKLQIRYSSFRDKTEPGSREKWAVEIGGYKGGRVAAQVLTAMYDASLDQFEPHSWWAPDPYPSLDRNDLWRNIDDFDVSRSNFLVEPEPWQEPPLKVYDRLIPAEFGSGGYRYGYLNFDRAAFRGNYFKLAAPAAEAVTLRTDARVSQNLVKIDGEMEVKVDVAPKAEPPVQVRTNFQETAFFLPDLRTDSTGAVSFSFTMPESLTRWKWMTLAHTRDLAFAYSEKTIVTQKQLMVQPNAPRFLREGDQVNLSVKVVNLTDSEMTGQMGLSLTDPTTGETADGWFVNRQPNQYFTVPARGSAVVEFPLDIPYQYNRPVSYRIVAQAGAYSDGEQAMLPVVSNRMLVTETLPLNMSSDGTRKFRFEKLLASGSSETLNNHTLTVEFTANPAWYAVQALPYLIEYPYECAEQTLDRLYANAVAGKIVAGSPRIAEIFERWRTVDTSALLSNLEKDQELKTVLLEETPWVMEGKTETQQKKNIALLFDLTRVSRQLASTVDQLVELQAPDGGFPWFKGGPDDRYVTQYILTGLGRLQRMQMLPPALQGKIRNITVAALGYADREIANDYQQDLKVPGGIHYIGSFQAQYLYLRSLFNDNGIPGPAFPAVNFYRKVARQNWVNAGKYVQGMVALALFRTGDGATARAILMSLRQTAIRSEELGMYWKGMEGGYYWYQAPVETESLLIEAFREIGHDTAADRQLKTWLLRQKQTHHWATTKATADAVHALLAGGSDWLDQERTVTVELGEKKVEWGPGSADASAGEAGTGYYKKIFDAPFINPSMGNIKVSMRSAGGGTSRVSGGGSPAWGAVYWQYFDQLDRITPPGGGKAPLRVTKRLFVQRNTDRGPVLDTIAENGTLHVGDRVIVRLVLRSDRDLEYVHLKDMRGACLEPLNALSGYRWQGGLGYYESTKDVSTEFFFSAVPKGVYVFEYPLVVSQTGEFSNGVASVECMYAPEFAAHTEGIRVNVEGGQ
ncbi:MAG TPA: alpha-2-macroglobulin family protein [Puia sp.]|jgi:uncharacterized protein YfaS (alpha-2-macroglobulin family)|nr:alpha-2-macroglobulin family protein [Puia sp.]